MPNYAQPFSQLGGYAGGAAGGAAGAAGGGILGALGTVLAPLDYPRQALWNLARSGGRALSGEGDWSDVASALPGALGAGLTGGLALSGVGLPAAIGLGSLLGGVSQGVGKATGNDAFNAADVKDLTGTEDVLPNLLVGALTDPLTYAGGIGGATKGAALGEKAGQQFGKGLEAAALWKGPNYGTTAEQFGKSMSEQIAAKAQLAADPVGYSMQMKGHLANMLDNPQVLSEIHPGSLLEGGGESTIAFRHPDTGHVITVRRPSAVEAETLPGTVDFTRPPPTRLDIPEQLQAVRSKPFEAMGGGDPLRVEHAPFLAANPRANVLETKTMARQLENQGMNPWDLHGANLGVTPEGVPLVRDANAIAGTRGYMSDPESAFQTWMGHDPIPRAAEMAQAQPGPLQNILLKLLGSGGSVENEIAAAAARGPQGGSQILSAIEPANLGALSATSPGDLMRTTSIVPNSVRQANKRLDRVMAGALQKRRLGD